MSLLRHVGAGIRRLVRGDVVSRELDDELAHWIELAIHERLQRGFTREQAERDVRLEMGSIGAMKERAQSGGWDAAIESLIRDVRYGLRGLRSSPAYALAAIATLSVAIAVATTFLTVSNTVLRQQWAVPNAARVFTLVVSRGG